MPDLASKVLKFLREQLGQNNVDGHYAFCRPRVYHSAKATFYSPSDISGVGGMRCEIIRAAPNWRKEGPRYDCVFVETDSEQVGFKGLDVARILLFFDFKYAEETYQCALIHWFDKVGDEPDELTGMWVVEKGYRADNFTPLITVIHLDTVLRAAHLIPVFGVEPLDPHHNHRDTLDTFNRFFVNKFADHHANEIAF